MELSQQKLKVIATKNFVATNLFSCSVIGFPQNLLCLQKKFPPSKLISTQNPTNPNNVNTKHFPIHAIFDLLVH